MSGIIFQRSEERIQIISQPSTYRILTGGAGPAGLTGGIQSPDSSVANEVAMTQAQYNLITPDPQTIYHIYVP